MTEANRLRAEPRGEAGAAPPSPMTSTVGDVIGRREAPETGAGADGHAERARRAAERDELTC